MRFLPVSLTVLIVELKDLDETLALFASLESDPVDGIEDMVPAARTLMIRFRPETGRTHQLRVHALAGLGAALLGDPIYGAGNAPGAKRTMLHAESLTVTRPGKPPIEARAALPNDFLALGAKDDGATDG